MDQKLYSWKKLLLVSSLVIGGWVSASAQTQVPYVNSGTHTVGTGVTSLRVIAWGGGGGGGYNGSGGGGGACATGVIPVTTGQQFTVTIGNAGFGGDASVATDGGNTSFGSDVIAAGGKRGIPGSGGGIGGAAAACTPAVGAFSGGNGFAGNTVTNSGVVTFTGGGGGGSATPSGNGGSATSNAGGSGFGVGGTGCNVVYQNGSLTNNQNASVGGPPGGGGGGGMDIASAANGSKGRVLVFECKTPVFNTHPQGNTVCSGNQSSIQPFTTSVSNAISYQWYSNLTNANTGGTVISGATTTSYMPPTNFTGTRYFYLNATNFCGEITASNVAAITITPLPATPTGAAVQAFATGATLNSLQLMDNQNAAIPSSEIRWYATSSSNTVLPMNTQLQDGVTYYGSRVVSNCESSGRMAVTASACDAPPAPTVTHISGTNAIVVSFVEDGSSQYYVQYGATGFTPATASNSGSNVLGGGFVAHSPDTIAGLPCSGSFEVYVYKICNLTNSPSANSAAGTVTISDPGASAVPWTEGFESMSAVAGLKPAGILPQCWKGDSYIEAINSTTVPGVVAHTGSNLLGMAQFVGPRYFWTKGIQLQAGVAYEFSFWWMGTGADDWTGAVFVNTQQDPSGATQLGGNYIDPGTIPPTAYAKVIRAFTPSANGIYYFGVAGARASLAGDPHGLAFDDFNVETCNTTPTISIGSNTTNTCSGNPINFTSTTTLGGNAPVITWYKNGSVIATGSSFSSAAFGPGDVVFAQIESNDPTVCFPIAYSSSINLTGTSSLPPSITLSHSAVCPRTPVTLTISGFTPSPDISFVWYKNGSVMPGVTSSTLVLDSLKAGDVDNFFAQAVTTNTACAPSSPVYSNSFTLSLQPYPSVTLKSNSVTAICDGSFITMRLLNPDTISNSFQWYVSGNIIPGATNSWYDATAAGGYSVMVTNANGCSKTSGTRALTLTPLPSITVTPAGPVQLCTGGTTTLDVSSITAGAEIRWYKNGNNTSVATTSYSATVTGTYAAQARLNGCSKMSNTVSVSIAPAPNSMVTLSGPTTFCKNNPTILSVAHNAAYLYQWQKSGANVSGATNNTFAPTVSGMYRVIIQNPGCGYATSAYKSVTVLAATAAVVQIQSQNDTSAMLRATVSPTGYTYRWFRNGSLISGATSRTYMAKQNGTYTMELTTVSSGCADLSAPVNILLANPSGRTIEINEEGAPVINIYPNPSSGIFHIAADEPVNAMVKDVQGRIILDIRNATVADLSPYAPGVYLMQLFSLDGKLLHTDRLIKK